MSKRIINVSGANPAPDKPGFFREIETALEQIRDRAFSLWKECGSQIGNSVDHWLQAERELFEVPDFEFSGKENHYTLDVSVPGYAANELSVTVDDGWIAVQGKSEQRVENKGEVESICRKELFRRLELPGGIDIDKVQAVLEKGTLRITIPKFVAASKPVEKEQPAEKAKAAAA